MDERKPLVDFIIVALSLFILAIGVKVFLPFLKPAAWAIIIVLFLYPVYNRLNKILKGRRALSASIMCIVVITFIILPAIFLSSALIQEAIKVYGHLKGIIESINTAEILQDWPWLAQYKETFLKYLPNADSSAKDIFSARLGEIGNFLIQQGTLLFKNIFHFIIYLVFTLVIIYYLFKDGDKFLPAVKELLPLSEIDIEIFIQRIYDVLTATLRGSFFTALIQGTLGCLILWVLGFSAPILWGTFMGIATFIPIFGTSIIWLPATVYLLVEGSIAKALILLVFSILIISQVDYFLRPILIGGRAKLHNLLLFFSIIGGLWNFGIIGIFLGPILVSLVVGILEIYKLKVLKRGA